MYQQYINQAVGRINTLSSDELKELFSDDEKLDEQINEIIATLESEKEFILQENRKLAEDNLNQEPIMILGRSKVNELTEEAEQLCKQVQEKSNTMRTKTGATDPDTYLALLQAASVESEDESEKIHKQFLGNELTIEQYIEQFLTTRKLMHLRKVKSEKMVELLRQKTNGPIGGVGLNSALNSGYSLPPTTNNFYPPMNPIAGNIPYPLGPVSMPMPGWQNGPRPFFS
uniref:Putative vacuolar protein sorting 37b n=1 Tax=Corethrella appendiculata TaxID=1370023 RepID=U5EQT3_9DIPT